MHASVVLIAMSLCVFANAHSDGSESTPCESRPRLTCFLHATMSNTSEGTVSTVAGKADFTSISGDDSCDDGACVTRINGTITGLGDATPHGWHVHQKGDISDEFGKSTGGHYNPANVSHALPDGRGGGVRHVGDLGNLIPDASGTATFDYTLQLDTSLIVGRGIIVHAGEDDGMGASGNAGARVAQCVLGRTDF